MSLRTIQVFWAENDKVHLAVLSACIEEMRMGEYFRFFSNGRDLYYALKDAEQLPGLIVIDVNMPGLSGLETLVYIKHHAAINAVPVVIISSNPNDAELCLNYGGVEFLLKQAGAADTSFMLREMWRKYFEVSVY